MFFIYISLFSYFLWCHSAKIYLKKVLLNIIIPFQSSVCSKWECKQRGIIISCHTEMSWFENLTNQFDWICMHAMPSVCVRLCACDAVYIYTVFTKDILVYRVDCVYLSLSCPPPPLIFIRFLSVSKSVWMIFKPPSKLFVDKFAWCLYIMIRKSVISWHDISIIALNVTSMLHAHTHTLRWPNSLQYTPEAEELT